MWGNRWAACGPSGRRNDRCVCGPRWSSAGFWQRNWAYEREFSGFQSPARNSVKQRWRQWSVLVTKLVGKQLQEWLNQNSFSFPRCSVSILDLQFSYFCFQFQFYCALLAWQKLYICNCANCASKTRKGKFVKTIYECHMPEENTVLN